MGGIWWWRGPCWRPAHFCIYVGLEHNPGIEDPPPEMLRMYQEIMETFARYIGP
jgi:hypothetical protein